MALLTRLQASVADVWTKQDQVLRQFVADGWIVDIIKEFAHEAAQRGLEFVDFSVERGESTTSFFALPERSIVLRKCERGLSSYKSEGSNASNVLVDKSLTIDVYKALFPRSRKLVFAQLLRDALGGVDVTHRPYYNEESCTTIRVSWETRPVQNPKRDSDDSTDENE